LANESPDDDQNVDDDDDDDDQDDDDDDDDAMCRKSVEAPNWMKAKEPRDVRLVMELIAQVFRCGFMFQGSSSKQREESCSFVSNSSV
jgi:hypothetical protein